MQRSSGQYDHLARVPCTGPRQSSGGRSFAPRHWSRETPRCSRGMEPTVRNPRIESARLDRCLLPSQQTIPERRLVSRSRNPQVRLNSGLDCAGVLGRQLRRGLNQCKKASAKKAATKTTKTSATKSAGKKFKTTAKKSSVRSAKKAKRKSKK